VCLRQERFSKVHASKQLHDRRLAAISYFGRKGKLDLFGGGWESLSNLPQTWQNELSGTISSLNPAPCNSKQATLKNYKFALCFENMEFPGYVTEKLIDCLVAGVVPIYWGAPDIQDFVPEECFINAQKFGSLQAVDEYLEGISEMEWLEIVRCGDTFLKGSSGYLYTYASFADRIQDMLIG
jgi:hypothetical protein